MYESKQHKLASAIATPRTLGILLLVIGMGLGSTTWAQPKIVPADKIPGANKEDVSGWNPSVGVSGTINFVSNSSVVGQVEGLSMLFGLGLTAGSDYVNGRTVWRNKLSINESFAKTPVLEDFVKTNDVIDGESIYTYFLRPNFGGFGRLNLKTALFEAEAFTAGDVTYDITDADGVVRQETTDTLQVAGPLEPFTIAESFGGFAEPIKSVPLNMRIRLGAGGRHTFADGVLVNNDNADTPNVEMQELTNVHQAGVELFIGIDGKAKGGRLTYALGTGVLIPFINNDIHNRSAFSLTSLSVQAEAKVAVFDWMSVVYKASLLVDPQLFPKDEELTQFQNSLLLTFQYTLIERDKKAAPESALKASIRAKEEAERAAREAEERARALELELEQARQNQPFDDPNSQPFDDSQPIDDSQPFDDSQPIDDSGDPPPSDPQL